MERRGKERDTLGIQNSTSYNPPQITQEPLKLPLAPLVSTSSDRRSNATAPTRRGSSIFSPTAQIADHHPPPHLSRPPPQKDPTRDADPPHTTTPAAGASSNPKPPASQPQPQPPAAEASVGCSDASPVRYRECLKNHAAGIGGHIVDGCGEFMAGGEEGTPEAIRCAACDCHRNFHRKEVNGEATTPQQSYVYYPYRPLPQNLGQQQRHQKHPAAESSSEDLNVGSEGHAAIQPSKKRFRTKFSQDQKDRMHEFAEKLDWRIQRQNDEQVQQFCSEVGVKRQVFKVWMHNNKQAMKKKQV